MFFMFPRLSLSQQGKVVLEDKIVLDASLITLVEQSTLNLKNENGNGNGNGNSEGENAEKIVDGCVIHLSQKIGNGQRFYCPLNINQIAEILYMLESGNFYRKINEKEKP